MCCLFHKAAAFCLSPNLQEFHEGDIVCNCHLSSKTIMSQHNLPSKKLKLQYVGLLYIYSKCDKFLYILSTIDGQIIEQLFHVSRLKQGFLCLPNNKVVHNIEDYVTE